MAARTTAEMRREWNASRKVGYNAEIAPYDTEIDRYHVAEVELFDSHWYTTWVKASWNTIYILKKSAHPVCYQRPVISGDTPIGSTIETSDGQWVSFSPITYTYQWQRNGVDIPGATAPTYITVESDRATYTTAVVTATSERGSYSVSSPFFAVALPVPESEVPYPELTGTGVAFDELSCTEGNWKYYDRRIPVDKIEYQWYGNRLPITPRLSENTFTPGDAEIGKDIFCRVYATNPTGTSSHDSNTILDIQEPVPFLTPGGEYPSITFDGEAWTGEVATMNNGDWSYASRFSYIWIINGVQQLETEQQFTIPDFSRGRLTGFIGAFNKHGVFSSSYYPKPVEEVKLHPPVRLSLPKLVSNVVNSDEVRPGDSLFATYGDWRFIDPPHVAELGRGAFVVRLAGSTEWIGDPSPHPVLQYDLELYNVNEDISFIDRARNSDHPWSDYNDPLDTEYPFLDVKSPFAVYTPKPGLLGPELQYSVQSGSVNVYASDLTDRWKYQDPSVPKLYRFTRNPGKVVLQETEATYYTIKPEDYPTGAGPYYFQFREVVQDLEGIVTLSNYSNYYKTFIPRPKIITPGFIEQYPNPLIDNTIICNPGEWLFVTKPFEFQWQKAGPQYWEDIPGEINDRLLLKPSMLKERIRCDVTGSNDLNSQSLSTIPVVPRNPTPVYVSGAEIIGDLRALEEVTAHSGVWKYTNLPFQYQFDRLYPNQETLQAFSENNKFKIPTILIGERLGYGILGLNDEIGNNNQLFLFAATLDNVKPPFPINDQPPTISDPVYVETELTVHSGGWQWADTYSYQWFLNASMIAGETTESYTPAFSERGGILSCEVSANNEGLVPTIKMSNELVIKYRPPELDHSVSNPYPVITRNDPNPGVIGTMTLNPGVWLYATSYAYQWQRRATPGDDYQDISGEISTTYIPLDSDSGASIRCKVTGINLDFAIDEFSNHLFVVGEAPVNTALPMISGIPSVGQVLTCSDGQWLNATSFEKLWYYGVTLVATGPEFRPRIVDNGRDIYCKVLASNTGSTIDTEADSPHVRIDATYPFNDPNQLPVIVGYGNPDEPLLISSNGAWYNTIPPFAFKWIRNSSSVIPDQTTDEYVPTVEDREDFINARVIGSNAIGEGIADSNKIWIIPPDPVSNTKPVISGSGVSTEPQFSTDGDWTAPGKNYGLVYEWWVSTDPNNPFGIFLDGTEANTITPGIEYVRYYLFVSIKTCKKTEQGTLGTCYYSEFSTPILLT